MPGVPAPAGCGVQRAEAAAPAARSSGRCRGRPWALGPLPEGALDPAVTAGCPSAFASQRTQTVRGSQPAARGRVSCSWLVEGPRQGPPGGLRQAPHCPRCGSAAPGGDLASARQSWGGRVPHPSRAGHGGSRRVARQRLITSKGTQGSNASNAPLQPMPARFHCHRPCHLTGSSKASLTRVPSGTGVTRGLYMCTQPPLALRPLLRFVFKFRAVTFDQPPCP